MKKRTRQSRRLASLIQAVSIAGAAALVVAYIAPSVVVAQSASLFVGSWVEDQSKRTIGSLRNLTFRQAANAGLEELRGSSAKPLVQAVHFDGKPYEVDQSRSSIVWKQPDATHFERTISQKGQLINTRRLQISADGTTLTEATETVEGANKTLATIVYRRMSGSGASLAGVWKPQSYKSDTPSTLRVEAAGNGLRVVTNEKAASRTAVTLTFDGKPAVVDGLATISGTANAGKRASGRSIEIAQTRDGVPTGRTTWSLSADGKTLTTSATSVGADATGAPTVVVYTRQ